MICGRISQIRKNTKILTHDRQRKMVKNITVIKITQREIQKVNSLILMQLQMLQYMIHKC